MLAHGDVWNVAPPLQWKPEEAPGAAPCLELLQNKLFGKAPVGVGFGADFGALPNRSVIMMVFTKLIRCS